MANSHVILPGSYRAAAANAVRVADVDPERLMELILDLKSRSELPEGHVAATWSAAELAQAYVPDAATLLKVKDVLARYNLQVVGESPCTPSLYVEGRAGDVEKAFRPGLSVYREFGRRAYIGRREGTYSIPGELAGLVLGVHGFDGRRVFKRLPRLQAVKVADTAPAAAQLPGLSPSQLASRYKFPAGDGAGQRIGIAEFGGAVFPDDLTEFAQKFNVLPPPQVAIKALGQPQDPADLDTSGEVNMDVQIIAGLCPAAQTTVYFAKFTQSGFVRMLDEVIADRPVVLSVSYGVSEDDRRAWSHTALAAINRRLNAARLSGITVCVSSGDDGTGCDMFDGGVHVEFPSSSPYVLAVGGTKVTGASEVTWWDAPGTRFEPNSDEQTGGGSTGGGVSHFPRPAWQTVQVKSLNPTAANGRIVPDVAALAGNPGSTCLMRFKDKNGTLVRAWEPGEGTSAAAPIWAALIARTNAQLPAAKQQRFLGALLYQTLPTGGPVGAAACTSITSGNNASDPDPGIGYAASGEFSAVTGWGIPDGTKLLTALSALP